MAEQLSTPRINARYLNSFTGKLVMIWGKVTQLRGDQASIDSDGIVNVLLSRESHLTNGNIVQVIGKVNPDLTVKVLNARDLGSDIDMSLYHHVVDITHKHNGVFGSNN